MLAELPASPLAGLLGLLGLPASSLHPHPGHIWPPTLSLISYPFTTSSSALSLLPAVTLRELYSVALTPSLRLQDFRKYEEGFDPYSMVREKSPPPGSNPRNVGRGEPYSVLHRGAFWTLGVPAMRWGT